MKIVPALALLGLFAVISGCAYSTDPAFTYWRKDPQTGFYSAHRTETALSATEIKELGLIESLPANAKTTD